jgi:hypothetical protein
MMFAYPLWLWLLPLAPALALLDWRADTSRRLLGAVFRTACAVSLILALAGPLLPWRNSAPTVVTVIDLDPNVPASALARARDFIARSSAQSSHLVVFSSRSQVLDDPRVLSDPSRLSDLRDRLNKRIWSNDLPSGAANLADALRLAGTLIPTDGRGQIHLFSDGRNDHEDAEAEAWRLAERGIPVVADPLEVVSSAPLRIRSLNVPAVARLGQTINATLNLESSVSAKVIAHLTAGDSAPVTVSMAVTPGENATTFALPLNSVGLTPIRVSLQTDNRTSVVSDETTLAAVFVDPPATVLLVQDGRTPAAELTNAVSALPGAGENVKSVSASQLSESDAGSVDAMILADVPAGHLTAGVQASIRRAEAGGMGLLVTGAAHSFGPGGYADSPLASILPVKMPQDVESIDPTTTLVLIIDTSGSMVGQRIDLAKEVARLAISHLQPHDKVGIVEFYGGKRWAAPIQSASNLSIIHRALDRLTAGGGTTLFPAVEEAAFALRNVRSRSKHVVICSDGFVEDAPFFALVRQLADDGVVVSTVQVTADTDGQNQMPDIARWGNGHYYIVPDEYALPDLSLKEPKMSLTSCLVQTPSDVSAGDDPLVREILAPGTKRGGGAGNFGAIDGYVRTQSRPTADVLLRANNGDPLLARWRYGAGYVAVLPTQLGSVMSSGLAHKRAFAALFSGLVRQMDDNRGPPLRIATTVRPAGVEVDVTALDGKPSSGTLRLTLTDIAGHTVRSASAEAIGGGRWNLLLPNVTAGSYTVAARVDPASASCNAGVSVPSPSLLLTTDRDVLNRIGGFGSLADESAAALPSARPDYFDAQKIFIAVATMSLLTHLAVRRWPVAAKPAFPIPIRQLI